MKIATKLRFFESNLATGPTERTRYPKSGHATTISTGADNDQHETHGYRHSGPEPLQPGLRPPPAPSAASGTNLSGTSTHATAPASSKCSEPPSAGTSPSTASLPSPCTSPSATPPGASSQAPSSSPASSSPRLTGPKAPHAPATASSSRKAPSRNQRLQGHWRTVANAGTVFELRDVPQSQAHDITAAALDRGIRTARIVDTPSTDPRTTAIAQIRALMNRYGIDASEL